MKTRIFLLLTAMIVFGSTFASAQVKIHGNRFSITDLIEWFVDEPEDELTGAVNNAWQNYRKHRPQEKNVSFVVDTRNGYMRYEHLHPEVQGGIMMEMCYWNCSDGKHRLIAINVVTTNEGKLVIGQYDGASFFLSNKASLKMESIPAEDLGLDLDYGVEFISYGYDAERGKNYIESKSGDITYMTEEEWEQWYDNQPINTLSLPRTGKDIILITHRGKNQESVTWTWDGARFHLLSE